MSRIDRVPGGRTSRRAVDSALLLAVGVFFLAPVVVASSANYAAIFGPKYVEAERYFDQSDRLASALRLPAEDARVAQAVVFPEVLRFSILEDAIQVRALKVLYVQVGRGYLNFSIGRFQMKPSFVEDLEADWDDLFTAEERNSAGIPAFDRADTSAARRDRILRLDDLGWQACYLRLFMLVMDRRYPRALFKTREDRVRFYATAYNAGYRSGERSLRRRMDERRFHTALLFPKTTYCYADIALDYFRRRIAREFPQCR